MTLRVLISAPYILPVIEEYGSRLEAEGVEIVRMNVRERLSEAELLPVIETIDGVICGNDQFTERVLRNASRLKVISKWGTGIDSVDEAGCSFAERMHARRGRRWKHWPCGRASRASLRHDGAWH